MILLDRVIDWTPNNLTAEVLINRKVPFFTNDGVPVHVAIEYMAQACGAFVGVEALQHGRAPRLGLLLGTRNFCGYQPWFCEGDRLRVTVEVVYRDDEMGLFDCTVAHAERDELVASARLTVFQPADGSTIGNIDG